MAQAPTGKPLTKSSSILARAEDGRSIDSGSICWLDFLCFPYINSNIFWTHHSEAGETEFQLSLRTEEQIAEFQEAFQLFAGDELEDLTEEQIEELREWQDIGSMHHLSGFFLYSLFLGVETHVVCCYLIHFNIF